MQVHTPPHASALEDRVWSCARSRGGNRGSAHGDWCLGPAGPLWCIVLYISKDARGRTSIKTVNLGNDLRTSVVAGGSEAFILSFHSGCFYQPTTELLSGGLATAVLEAGHPGSAGRGRQGEEGGPAGQPWRQGPGTLCLAEGGQTSGWPECRLSSRWLCRAFSFLEHKMEKAPPAGLWRGLAGTRGGAASRVAPSPGSTPKPGPLLGRWGAGGPVALLGSHSVRERPGAPTPCRRAPRLPTPPFRAPLGVFSQRGCVGAGAGGGLWQRVAAPSADQSTMGFECCLSLLLTVACHQKTAQRLLLMTCRRVTVLACPAGPRSLGGARLPRPLCTAPVAEGSWALAVTGIGTPEESSWSSGPGGGPSEPHFRAGRSSW